MTRRSHLVHRWTPWVIALTMVLLTVGFINKAIWWGVVVYGLFSVAFILYAWLRWEIYDCLVCTKKEYERSKGV